MQAMNEMDLININVRERANEYRREFENAKPFKHVVIDDFLRPEVAESLLAEFPTAEDKSKLVSEFGDPHPKSARADVKNLKPSYVRMDQFIQTRSFLDLIEEITGVAGLTYDPWYYGGGTHENFHGAGLDPHFDFNIHPKTGFHRRLNVIVYLNKDWDPAWQGSICFHSDPWDLKGDQIKVVETAFNRCAIFETTERSWHSVPPVDLPPDKRHLSRKSFTIYLYTETRPAEEIAPQHATVYVQRGLPSHIKAGRTLTEQDEAEIYNLLARRDAYLKNLYKREYQFSQHVAGLKAALAGAQAAMYVPVVGYAKVLGVQSPPFPDMFMDRLVEFKARLFRSVKSVKFMLYVPDFLNDATLAVAVGGQTETRRAGKGMMEIQLRPLQALEGDQVFRITSSASRRPSEADQRNLSVVIERIELEH
jgi:Rps23 Pro-64 3,4-dihydroxylase Tpa1-like proline 4-hydroxylase